MFATSQHTTTDFRTRIADKDRFPGYMALSYESLGLRSGGVKPERIKILKNKGKGSASFTEQDAKDYIDKNINHINRLRRTIIALATAQHIIFYMQRLQEIGEEAKISADINRYMDIEAFVTIIIISYRRLFNESKGVPVFKKKFIPTNFIKAHEEIISLRNERYAHHGEHETVVAELELFVTEYEVEMKIHWWTSFYEGAAPHWQELFEWMLNYIKESFRKQLDYLSRTTGKNWSSFDPHLALEEVIVQGHSLGG